MKGKPDFASWFKERDQQVISAHLRKDRATLIKTIRELEAERDEARAYQARLEKLLESIKELQHRLQISGQGGA